MTDYRKHVEPGPKQCSYCPTKTPHGRYVPIDKYHQRFACTRCADRLENAYGPQTK